MFDETDNVVLFSGCNQGIVMVEGLDSRFGY